MQYSGHVLAVQVGFRMQPAAQLWRPATKAILRRRAIELPRVIGVLFEMLTCSRIDEIYQSCFEYTQGSHARIFLLTRLTVGGTQGESSNSSPRPSSTMSETVDSKGFSPEGTGVSDSVQGTRGR